MENNFTLCVTRETLEEFTVLYLDNDVPVDLTGYTAEMQIRKQSDDDIVLELLSSSMTGARLIITPLEGKVVIYLTTAATKSVPAATYNYDLALVLAGEVTRPIRGQMIFTNYITEVS